jgi:Asp-tRNA(Asn)/Glu-tRNA(Gln) amidotransferase A subunit family amidase
MPSPALESVNRALARIAERDREVRAWTALAPAAARQAALATPQDAPLYGLVLGVKDVIDVAGMATGHNSPLGNPAPALGDAPCVAVLREAGAIVLGKTDTTEFAAAGRNAATANPHALHRTPGGSSSGSAAAVADGHVPIALATQTGGSTIRPASFCGIPALKPTWGAISREGAKLYANSLDTIGLYGADFGLIDRMASIFGLASAGPLPPRLKLGLCRSPAWGMAEPETIAAMQDAAARLRAHGAEVVDIDLPPLFDGLAQAFHHILFREGAAAFLNLARCEPHLLHADFHARVASLAQISDAMLCAAYDQTALARIEAERLLASCDAFLTPSAPGVAPEGRGPGNPVFNQMWTQLHLPVANLPLYRVDGTLPLGLSLVGPRFADRRLIALGQQVIDLLGQNRRLDL